jgi:hypothetical protein
MSWSSSFADVARMVHHSVPASIAALSGGGLNPIRRPNEHPANVNPAPGPVSF